MRVSTSLFTSSFVAALLAVACGGSTDAKGTGSSSGAGGSAGDGSGGASGASTGGASTGGASAGGSATGGVSGSGGVATGGSGGVPNSCFRPDGSLSPGYTHCTTDSECGQRLVPTCCGSDLLVGMRSDSTCVVPGIDCGGLGCAKFLEPRTDDGNTVPEGSAADAWCDNGTCHTRLVRDAGAPDCGGSTCGAAELCIHPPTSVGGPAPECVPPVDGGACPPGTAYQAFCVGSASGGCVQVYVPPPPYCAGIPAGCGATVDCSCIPQNLCGGGADFCQSVEGHTVTCVNLAP
ncbi:MAG TPA: hypothetical protein VHE30_13105 [Polyangiaceae bacterium]|nr:hypothetical protein [Polyangiaceae bacterium]